MISNLQELIAPLTAPEFSDLLHDHTLTFRRSSGENRFAALLDWDGLRGFIESGAIPTDKFHVRMNTHKVPPVFYAAHGKVNAEKFAQLFEKGASVITDPIQTYVPHLKTLCENISAQIGEQTQADVVVSTGAGGALKMHFDPFDVVVLQAQGSKRWRIHGPPVRDPIRGMPQQTPPQNEPIFDEVLRPGDLPFMPGGYWHHCDNGPDVSLHLAIIMRAPTGWHALKALVPQLLTEETFRAPFSRFADPAEKRAHEASLKARLIEKIERMSMSELADETIKAKGSDTAEEH